MNYEKVFVQKVPGVCLLSFVLIDVPYAQEQRLTTEDVQLEQITVTAQRRVQNIQDVPVSVTALPESFLTNNDIRTIEDLNGTVPGFYATNSTNYGAAPLSIRGIGGANGGGNSFNDEPVAIYVDDVYIARTSIPTADLVDVDYIQVLRGPQGTLYGRNSTAGALLINSARPSEDFTAYLKGSVAQYGEKRISGAISGSLTDTWQARFAFGYTDREGWANNTYDGSSIASSESNTARLSIRYVPSENFTADLILDSQQREASPATLAIANVLPGVASSPFISRDNLQQLLDNNDFALNDANYNDTDTSGVTLKINWDLGPVLLDSITSTRSNEVDGKQDSDGTEYTLFTNSGLVESKQLSQEFRLSSNYQSNISWIIGTHFLQEEVEQFFVINNFQAIFNAGTSSIFDAKQESSAFALFADATWDISEQLSLTLGIRYSKEEKEFINTLAVNTMNDSLPIPISVLGLPVGFEIPANSPISPETTVEYDDDFNDTSPRVLLNYQFKKNILGYVSYNQGYKSGGFNSFGLSSAFASENIDAYEIGVKSDLLNNQLRLNAATFTYDYTDLQVRLPVTTGGVNIDNAGKAEIKGLEIELTYAFTSDFILSANATWMDTNLTEFFTEQIPDDSVILLGSPIPLESINATGNELTRAPQFQYFVNGTYNFELGDVFLADFNVSVRHQDEVFFLETNQNTSTFSGPDITELSVRLSVTPIDEVWTIGLFGQNITDQRTITQVAALGGYPNAALNEPSKWGIDFVYHF
ncbi:MAG: TonB-dependent receptor [Paraglaciecola sp.]|uniref:TonB-dependent receptor n=1 Tax=Paraglaciecola sp. TaxID=1920173 RepID=UPI0032977EA5